MDITISEATYNRLAMLASGFETPEAVINRLIDAMETVQTKKPELFFSPTSEDDFKKALLVSKQARVELFKQDGSSEEDIWKVRALSEQSSLRANLWSGYLRNWREKGIVRAIFTVLPAKL